MTRKNSLRFVTEQRHDEEMRPYIEQLMQAQTLETNDEGNNTTSTNDEQNDESGSLVERKVRGPTLLKDIWSLPPGKTVAVQFNRRNQAIGKEGRKLASFVGIVARTPELTPLNINDWRIFPQDEKKKLVEFVKKKFSIPTRGEEFVKKSLGKKWKDYKCDLKNMYLIKYKTKDALLKNRPDRIPRDQWTGLVSYWFSDKAKKRSQANRINRAKQKMPHTGGSKSIACLMDEKTKDGIEPTRAEIFIETHKKRKDGRPLDEESAKTIDMIKEKLSNVETSNELPTGSVAWEGDVYSQVLGSERSGHVRGLGLGPTPSLLWGNRSSQRDFDIDDVSNETVQRLEQQIKDLKEKHVEEMNVMKAELTFMRQAMCKFFPTELSMPQDLNGSSSRQVPDTNSSHERVTQRP